MSESITGPIQVTVHGVKATQDALRAAADKLHCAVEMGIRHYSDTAPIVDLAIAQLAIGDYAPIRSEYWLTLAGTIREYLYTDGVRITKFRNDYRKAIQQAFYPAFEQGLTDGGGEVPATGDDLAWINAKADAERGFADALFQSLKELKDAQKAENAEAKEEGRLRENLFEGVPERRADGYARTLDGIYGEGKIRGAKDQMLTFGGSDGMESCATCQKLKGVSHRASWWVKHRLIPGQPGNDSYDCGGFQCQHILYNQKGEIFNV